MEPDNLAKAIARQRVWDRELARLGLPTFRQAVEAGMELSQWRRTLEKAGAWTM